MIMKWLCAFAVILQIFCAGCSLFGSEEPVLAARTDQQSYAREQDEIIVTTVRNVSSATVHYSQCMREEVEELSGARVVARLSPVVCFCGCPAELKPGEAITYETSVRWIMESDALVRHPEHSYRLRFRFFKDSKLKRPLDEVWLYTNRFRLSAGGP